MGGGGGWLGGGVRVMVGYSFAASGGIATVTCVRGRWVVGRDYLCFPLQVLSMPSLTVRPSTTTVKCCYRVLVSRSFREGVSRTSVWSAGQGSRPSSPGSSRPVTTHATSLFAVAPPPAPVATGRKAPPVSEPPASSPAPTKLYGLVQHLRVTVLSAQDLDQRKEGVTSYVPAVSVGPPCRP